MSLTTAIIIILIILLIANFLVSSATINTKTDKDANNPLSDAISVNDSRVASLRTIPVKIDDAALLPAESNLTYIDLLNASVKVETSDEGKKEDENLDKDLSHLLDKALGRMPTDIINKQDASLKQTTAQEAELSGFIAEKMRLNNSARYAAAHNTLRDGFH